MTSEEYFEEWWSMPVDGSLDDEFKGASKLSFMAGAKFRDPEVAELKRQRDDLAEALRAKMALESRGPQPRKLDAALTWRKNDELAQEMAEKALAAIESKGETNERT